MAGNWFCEENTPGYSVQWRIQQLLHQEKTPFQDLIIADLTEWGRTLILDGAVQYTERDEFIYHEMIAHIPLMSHPDPNEVLIIGGGDGGTLREVLKHRRVKRVDLVEIDQRVVEISQAYLPGAARGFEDNRACLHIADGIKFVRETAKKYDVILVDSSDPVGPAIQLYSHSFYEDIYQALADDGMLVAQSESPLFYPQIFDTVVSNLRGIFPLIRVYLAVVPTYVSGFWSFTAASKCHDPLHLADDRDIIDGLKYYNRNIHQAAFSLPQFILERLGQ
jgi:spermidine synthase